MVDIPAAEQPLAQLTFLTTGQARHLLRIVGLLLNQRQRLKYGVVQMRGDLFTFVVANSGRTLGAESPPHPQPQRHRQQTDTDQRHHHGQQGRAQCFEVDLSEDDDAETQDDQGRSPPTTRAHVRTVGRCGKPMTVRGTVGVELAPHQSGTDRDDEERCEHRTRRAAEQPGQRGCAAQSECDQAVRPLPLGRGRLLGVRAG